MRGFPGPHLYGPRLFAGGFSFLLGLLILGLLVYLVMLARRNGGPTNFVTPSTDGGMPPSPALLTPIEVLKMRYARGEINREEYETMRRDLE
ncbi:MAG TPA: SHOCT domain-containing protein [Actinomycetota bacterium]|nr:SHOCT domain-containing protein [Actinomycetota bacterium]